MTKHLPAILGGALVVALIYYAVKPTTKLTFYEPFTVNADDSIPTVTDPPTVVGG